jgi:hypothetical protein
LGGKSTAYHPKVDPVPRSRPVLLGIIPNDHLLIVLVSRTNLAREQ